MASFLKCKLNFDMNLERICKQREYRNLLCHIFTDDACLIMAAQPAATNPPESYTNEERSF